MPPANPSALIPAPESIELPDADVRLWRRAWPSDQADALLSDLLQSVHWEQEEILMFGQRRLVPRLVAWYGDPAAVYTYSGTLHVPRPWTPTLTGIRIHVETMTGQPYNSVLLNRYRDGRDGMGWHADAEPELGRDPVIASVSFGATRTFQLRHRRKRETKVALELGHGDLLLMAGSTQRHYLHAVAKTTRPVGERVNLTFRHVLGSLT